MNLPKNRSLTSPRINHEYYFTLFPLHDPVHTSHNRRSNVRRSFIAQRNTHDPDDICDLCIALSIDHQNLTNLEMITISMPKQLLWKPSIMFTRTVNKSPQYPYKYYRTKKSQPYRDEKQTQSYKQYSENAQTNRRFLNVLNTIKNVNKPLDQRQYFKPIYPQQKPPIFPTLNFQSYD